MSTPALAGVDARPGQRSRRRVRGGYSVAAPAGAGCIPAEDVEKGVDQGHACTCFVVLQDGAVVCDALFECFDDCDQLVKKHLASPVFRLGPKGGSGCEPQAGQGCVCLAAPAVARAAWRHYAFCGGYWQWDLIGGEVLWEGCLASLIRVWVRFRRREGRPGRVARWAARRAR